MTYASDLGLTVSSKIKITHLPDGLSKPYREGDILELKVNDKSICLRFRNLTTKDNCTFFHHLQ